MSQTWPPGTLQAGPEDPFWGATARGVLLIPRCEECSATSWPPRPFCPCCATQRAPVLVPSAGAGTVYSYTVVRRARGDFRELVPYVVAYVELDEGLRLLSNIAAADPESVRIGQRVEVVFDEPGEDPAAPRRYRFRPA
ncbi:MAG: Zn-ribbon domain-containing OB-fold protein [Thermoleophilia bacterium]|nr:Zn-ribbon domain-containing OB-fold protein [Thermoleophilia bacterium]